MNKLKWGLIVSKFRSLSRIFAKDGKSITLALDGFYFTQNTDGIDRAMELLPDMRANGLNTVLVTYGSATIYEKELSDIGMLLRVDLTTTTFDPSIPKTEGVISVEEAVKLGADGIISMTFPGSAHEFASHKLARDLARDAKEWNIAFMAETLPYSYAVTTPESNSVEAIAAAGRLGAELGADIIKTRFTGQPEDALIVKKAKKPVFALGGPQTDDRLVYFTFIRHCMDMGAKGVAIGRNIIKDPDPVAMIAALNHIVHVDGTAEEAYGVYKTKRGVLV